MSQHNQASGNIDIDTGREMVGGRKTVQMYGQMSRKSRRVSKETIAKKSKTL